MAASPFPEQEEIIMTFRNLTVAITLITLTGCCGHRNCRQYPLPPDPSPCNAVPVVAQPALPPSSPIPPQPVPAAPASQRVTRVAEGPY